MAFYKGIWTFAPMSENTFRIANAENEEEAVEKLTAWALEHTSIVDNPHDFTLEMVSDDVIDLVVEIVCYDDDYDSPEKAYLTVINKQERKALLRKYKKQRRAYKKSLKNWDSPIEHHRARLRIERLDEIIPMLATRKEVN